MPFLNVFYNIHDIFAQKSIEKTFSFEKYRAKYRVSLSSLLFFKCTVIGTVVSFLAKYQYHIDVTFKSTECPPLSEPTPLFHFYLLQILE